MLRPVFISYSRLDGDAALRLVEFLREQGVDPWLDQSSIPVSVPWWEEIVKAVRSAEVVLALDSEHWRGSLNCQREIETARHLHKDIVMLDAKQPEEWFDRISAVIDEQPATEGARALLLGDSHRWHSAGRQKQHLPTGRVLKAYRAAAKHGRGLDPLATEFLQRAMRSSRARWTRRFLAAAVTLVLWVAMTVTRELPDQMALWDEKRLQELAITSDVINRTNHNAYWGLQRAIDKGLEIGETGPVVEALTVALDAAVPVIVDNPTGAAPEPARPLSDDRVDAGEGAEVTLDQENGWVEIRGPRPARVQAVGPVTAIRWSPRGDRLAIADAAGILISDLRSGRSLARLRGLEGSVDSLTWIDAHRIQAGANRVRAEWELPVTTLAEGRSDFVDLSTDDSRHKALAGSRDGTVTLIEGSRVSEPIPVPPLSEVSEVTWAHGQWVVLGNISGENPTLVLVGEDGSIGSSWPVPQCSGWSLAPGPGNSVLVACPLEYEVRLIDLATGEAQHRKLDAQPTEAILDHDGSIVAGSYNSEIMRLPPSGAPHLVGQWSSLCTFGAVTLVPSPDLTRFVVGGQGPAGCTKLHGDPADRASNHPLVVRGRQLEYLRAATWTANSRVVVLGWAKGEIWFYDASEATTLHLGRVTGASLSGVALSTDEKTLLAVTSTGEVLSLSTGTALMSFDDRLRTAQERLRIGIHGGLV